MGGRQPHRREPLRRSIQAGLDPARAAQAQFTVYSYVIGFTIEEQAVYPEPGKPDQRYAALDTAATTVLRDTDSRFEDGLTIVLIGARHWLRSP